MTKLERIIWNLPPFQFLAEKTGKIILPGFEGLSLYTVVLFSVRQIKKAGLTERASAISFNFLMAVPATFIFLFTLVPYIPASRQFTLKLLELAKDLTPNYNTYTLIKGFITDFLNTPRNGLLSVGFLLAVFYASNAMMGIMRTFDRTLIPEKKRRFLSARWMAIKLTSLFILLLICTIILQLIQDKILSFLLPYFNSELFFVSFIIKLLRWIIVVGLVFYSVAFVYKYAPSIHKRWQLRSPGTLLATFLIILNTFLFSFWVNNFGNFNKLYGSIGTVIIIMLLIYLNSLILLLGFELNVNLRQLVAANVKKVKP